MADAKEAWSSDRNAHTAKEKLHGYKGFLGFRSQNEDFQNLGWRGKRTPLLNVARLKRENLEYVTHNHILLSRSCVAETPPPQCIYT